MLCIAADVPTWCVAAAGVLHRTVVCGSLAAINELATELRLTQSQAATLVDANATVVLLQC